MTRITKNNDSALNAFMAEKAKIDEKLSRLSALSSDHFGANPDEINWGHVTAMADYAKILQELTDRAFKEGEYA